MAAGSSIGGAFGSGNAGASSSDTGANPGAVTACTATEAQWCAGLSGGSLLEYASSIARDPQGNLVILGRTEGSIAGDGPAEMESPNGKAEAGHDEPH